MLRVIVLVLAALVSLAGCKESNRESKPNSLAKDNIGKPISIEGRCENRKGGACVVDEAGAVVWVDGLNQWAEGLNASGDQGKKVKVTGVLAEDNALPVYIPEDKYDLRQGIPMPKGTDLAKASHRYLLKNVQWSLAP
jgi:hypothetical protein